jgi:hypothetical protein
MASVAVFNSSDLTLSGDPKAMKSMTIRASTTHTQPPASGQRINNALIPAFLIESRVEPATTDTRNDAV